MSLVDSGPPSDVHSLVTVQLRDVTRELTVVNIGTILGVAHLIPETERRWLVNSRINLRTFNGICWDHRGGLYNKINSGSDVAWMWATLLPDGAVASRSQLGDKRV